MKKHVLTGLFFAALVIASDSASAQQKGDPKATEYYTPVPKVVTPGKNQAPPSDAVVLFDGSNLDHWVSAAHPDQAAQWTLSDERGMTVNKQAGDIQTKDNFTDFQLHIEYRIPSNITGTGQARGNSGIFLASVPNGAGGYELQVLDNYNNSTYVNGQAGSIYKQNPPLVNPCLPPGEWQQYDVVWTAPRFAADGSLISPARVTAFLNGVLVQNNFILKGDTPYIGQPQYHAHGPAPIRLQAHGDKSEPISYRNIWLRNL